MNITGIRPYETVGYFGKVNSLADLNKESNVAVAENNTKPNGVDLAARARQTETSYDFAKKYEPNKSYSMKGSEADLSSLDKVRKPMNTKDEAISQYKEYAGNNNDTAEAVRRAKDAAKQELENFSIAL